MTPDTPTADDSRSAAAQHPPAEQPGRVAELGLVSAGLGLVIYLIGFVADLGGTSSLVLPLLLGGGLLAGTVALPTVRSGVLAPAAVMTTTGALLLLRAVVDDGSSALTVGALVLGLLTAGAAVGATLLQAGVQRSRTPKPRRSSAPPGLAGQPDGPQFAGQQYPGQPYPGAYAAGGAAPEPYPADQWTGEHAYGQNARYGGEYGVPGYPPPPPFATPGHDPAPYVAQAPPTATGMDAADDTASPDPAAEAFRSSADPATGTGTHRAVPDPATSTGTPRAIPDLATGTGTHRAIPDSGTGSFRTGSWSAPEGAGPHRAASGTGSYPPVGQTPPVSGTGSYRRAGRLLDDDGEHTRTLPAVPDEQQR